MRKKKARGGRGFALVELMVAVALLAVVFVVLPAYFVNGVGFLREADRAGEALRLAESQIEFLRAMPAERRPVGRNLPALAGEEALGRLPEGTCAVTVEPWEGREGARLLRVRVTVAWAAEGARRDVELSTVMGGGR